MVYPDNATLLARGKWATLGREKYALIRDAQTIGKKIMHLANPFLEDCQEELPADETPLKELHGCLKGAEKIRGRLVEIATERASLKAQAWGQ